MGAGGSYAEMKPLGAIRAFCCLSIVVGLGSIGVQIAALCFLEFPDKTLDVAGAGIWAGVFYVISGSLGLAAASKKTKSLIIPTVVLSAVSIAAATVATVLAGVSTSYFCSTVNYAECYTWYGLEWGLLGINIYAFCNSVVLTVLMSVALCTSGPRIV